MKYMKHLILVLVLAMVAVGTVIGTDVSVQAQAQVTSDGFEYEISEVDNAIFITDYSGNGGDVIIPSEIEGKPVTGIGYMGFAYCSNLTSITVPDSVTSIGNSAFSGCSKLTSITIPDSVTDIGSETFADCSNLTSINLPKNLTSIANRTFENCTKLVNITIPDSVTSIGKSTFSGCSNLARISLSNNLKEIGEKAFYASHLTTVTLPPSVTNIKNVFSGCSYLVSVNIPDSVINMDGAFDGCTRLISVNIPDSVTSIDGTFCNCTNLSDITIPDSVISMVDAFRGCTNLSSITIPDSVINMAGAFSGCTDLSSVNIPDGVTSINRTFCNCTNLSSITIPDSVISMVGAFRGCSSLSSVNIPDGVTSIDGTFYDCTNLSSITIPDSVTTIGDSTFKSCQHLTSITIPDGVTTIGDNAFESCRNLTSISLPGSITNLGKEVFMDSGLTCAILSNGITTVSDCLFADCRYLHSVIIPDTVTSLGYDLFTSTTKHPISSTEAWLYRARNIYFNSGINIYYTGTKDNWNKIVNPYFDYNAKASVTVHYNSTFPKQITLDVSELELFRYGTYTITPTLTPDNVTVKDVMYFTSNSSIAFCYENGEINAHYYGEDGASTGTTTITAMTANGLTAQIKVNVIDRTEHSCDTEGHIEVSDDGYSATCTEPGLSDGSHCSVCDKTLVEQEEIPALGHNWGIWSTIKLPTPTEKGERMRTCKVCNISEVQSILYTENTEPPEETEKPADNTPITETPGSKTPAPAQTQTPLPNLPVVTPEVPTAPTVIIPPSAVQNLTAKNKKKKAVTLSWKKTADANGYEIQYAANKKFTKQKKSKVVTSTKVTIKKLKKNKTYYFRVRAYRWNGTKKVYGKWSVVKKATIKK